MEKATLSTKPANSFRGNLTIFGLVGIAIGGTGIWGPSAGLFAMSCTVVALCIIDDVTERVTKITIES